MHALDGLGAQLGEEARHVLLVLSFLSLKNFGRLPLDGFNALLLLGWFNVGQQCFIAFNMPAVSRARL